jgi:hypothetical protein
MMAVLQQHTRNHNLHRAIYFAWTVVYRMVYDTRVAHIPTRADVTEHGTV